MIDLTGPQRRLADTGPRGRPTDTGPRRQPADTGALAAADRSGRPGAASAYGAASSNGAASAYGAASSNGAARRGHGDLGDGAEYDAGAADTAPKSRRRIAWRKGADVDEELWPAEGFGGVSDEQFWDDLAADKPLATTARTAQSDSAPRVRRPNAGPLPELRPGDNRTDTRPVQAATQPSPNATQPARASYPAAGMAPDEDPLTSPAYSLRSKARSPQSSRRSDLTRDQYQAATSQDTQTFSLAETQAATGGYPGGVPPFRQFDQPARGNGRARSDAPRPDPLSPTGYRTDPLRTDPLRTDPPRTDLQRTGQLRPDPVRPDPARPDPLRSGGGSRPGSPNTAGTVAVPAYRSGSASASGSADAYGDTGPYAPQAPYASRAANPYPPQPRGGPTQPGNAGGTVTTPPYGEAYGYGDPAGYASPVGDPRRDNGGRSPGRADGDGTSRHAYPPADGHRGPHHPRDHGRR